MYLLKYQDYLYLLELHSSYYYLVNLNFILLKFFLFDFQKVCIQLMEQVGDGISKFQCQAISARYQGQT